MCGITGILAFTEEGKKYLDKIDDAVKSLHHRGPDGHGVFRHGNVALGHTRLAIIDTSEAASQPFTSGDGRYTIVFNGEIFNYRELRAELEREGYKFRSQSDTEVLLTLYSKDGKECLKKLNGFFAFAVYDNNDSSLFLARDRFGEKPLYWGRTENSSALYFSSEIQALYALGISKTIDLTATFCYFQLNYIPPEPWSIDSKISPLGAAHCAQVFSDPSFPTVFYKPWLIKPKPAPSWTGSYDKAVLLLREKLELATNRRLVSDVALGSFLSGGVDSSIIAAIAKKSKSDIQTFSIGYADEPYFDETRYANMVSKHLGTKHHVFSLTSNDLLASLHSFLENIDEPFADSSALALNALSKETRKHVTVALSGDGADELFAGYNKHAAEWRIRQNLFSSKLIKAGSPIWTLLPASRNSNFGNKVRQLRKFATGMSMSAADRYWNWASITGEEEVRKLIVANERDLISFASHKDNLVHFLKEESSLNSVLEADMNMVLQGDMLVKVDRMSMLNGLEVRPPFLDHEVVDFALSLPSEYKIDKNDRKKILKDAFRELLPAEIFSRKKKGFEVPLLKWFRGDLRGMIDELLDEKFLKEQNLFHPAEVKNIRKQLYSSDPGDSAARIWGLIVFQSWWKKYLG